ncbi:MAG: flavodoxin family protein, partial [Desulfovibrio sp.]
MHIVLMHGSARKKGNSADMAAAFTETALSHGSTVSSYHLNTMEYQGCQGCFGCKTKSDRCILKDDLAPVLDEIRDCDC